MRLLARQFSLFLLLCAVWPKIAAASEKTCLPHFNEYESYLFKAMNSRDELALEIILSALQRNMGEPAPDIPERYLPPAKNVESTFTQQDLIEMATGYLSNIKRKSWWLYKRVPDPGDIPYPLRTAADMLRARHRRFLP